MFVDVAISAPFGDQPGTVYIYACSTGDILSLNLIQVTKSFSCLLMFLSTYVRIYLSLTCM